MKQLTSKFLIVLFCLGFTVSSNAELIINGGFEDPDITNGTWANLGNEDVTGWNGDIAGEGDNIEIWDSLNGVQSYGGSEQHAELNAHGDNGDNNTWELWQTFDTISGGEYSFSFAYMARTNNNEMFNFELLNTNFSGEVINNNDHNNWMLYSGFFIASSTTATISFTSVNPSSRTVGNFLDAVSVSYLDDGVGQTSVPEPSILTLFGMVLLALGWRRYKLS